MRATEQLLDNLYLPMDNALRERRKDISHAWYHGQITEQEFGHLVILLAMERIDECR